VSLVYRDSERADLALVCERGLGSLLSRPLQRKGGSQVQRGHSGVQSHQTACFFFFSSRVRTYDGTLKETLVQEGQVANAAEGLKSTKRRPIHLMF
jgi:hypothetical protein